MISRWIYIYLLIPVIVTNEISYHAKSYKDYSVISVIPKTEKNIELITNLTLRRGISLWTAPSASKSSVKLVVSPIVKEKLIRKLEKHGMIPEIVIKNLKTLIEQSNDMIVSRSADDEESFFKAYQRFDNIQNYLTKLSETNPDLVKIKSFGKSSENRDLILVKITEGKNSLPNLIGPKPIIYIEGGIHAREWISPATVLFMLSQLINSNDTDTRDLRQYFEWWIAPIVNPDGYEYSHSKKRLWRKSRSKIDSNPCHGVDLNRNFGFKWGVAGTSNRSCADTFRGPKPFSEPESRAIRDLILKNTQRIKAFFDFHAFSQVWLIPYGFSKVMTHDYLDLEKMAHKATSALQKVQGTVYRVGNTATVMYPAAGGVDDWAKGVAKIKYTYCVELPDEGKYGFVLPASSIIPVGKETWTAIKVFANELKNEINECEENGRLNSESVRSSGQHWNQGRRRAHRRYRLRTYHQDSERGKSFVA